VDEGGKSLVGPDPDPARRKAPPFHGFSNFSHAAHLAPPPGKYPVSGKVSDGCRTCHFPEIARADAKMPFAKRTPSQEPVGREHLIRYDASCVPCHQPWAIEGHGVGEWACTKCHVLRSEKDASGREVLPMARADVERRSLSEGVRFQTHHHPFITTSGIQEGDKSQPGDKVCADCHKASIAEIDSRYAGKGFRHEPHLPKDPKSSDCVKCHTSVLSAAWSGDLEKFDPHLSPPASAAGPEGLARGCLECHVGETPERIGIRAERANVPEFGHKHHVSGEGWKKTWKGGVGIPCADCHGQGGATGYETPEDVANCKRCHSHDTGQTEKYARTGPSVNPKDPEAAKRCFPCHEDVVQPKTYSKPAVRERLALRDGKQRHVRTGACAECHDRKPSDPSKYVARIASATIPRTPDRTPLSIHKDPAFAGRWFNDQRIATPGFDPQGRTCMTCHRQEPLGYLSALERK
jgi:hypothetical protein